MQQAPSDDPCPVADAASADSIENTSGVDVEAEESSPTAAPTKSTGGKRDGCSVRLDGAYFRFLEMFEADPEARASICEDFRNRKPTRTKLVMAALQRPGWRLPEEHADRLARCTTAEDEILSRDRAERAAAFKVQLGAQMQQHAAQLQAAESLVHRLQHELTCERAERQQQAERRTSKSVPLLQRRRRVRRSRLRQPSDRPQVQRLESLPKRHRPPARSGICWPRSNI